MGPVVPLFRRAGCSWARPCRQQLARILPQLEGLLSAGQRVSSCLWWNLRCSLLLCYAFILSRSLSRSFEADPNLPVGVIYPLQLLFRKDPRAPPRWSCRNCLSAAFLGHTSFLKAGFFLTTVFFFFFFSAVPAGRWPPALMCWIGSQVLPAERRVGPLLTRTCPPQEQLPGGMEIGWRQAPCGH